MGNSKHYIITAITLGIIGAGSAGLIGLTNLITKDQIEKNQIEKINKGLAMVFEEGTSFSEANSIDGVQYLDAYYTAKKESDTLGYIFQTTGSNMYGKISMLVGIDTEFEVGNIYLVTNEQTYAQTLVDNYVNPYNKDDVELDDVSCGATYGAKLVRTMAQAAQSWAKANL
ncbi:MAG: hypothetical protein J6X03_05065 [Bacilli bacterium]|nr:hypothetical protein [Bacilli bacterium]